MGAATAQVLQAQGLKVDFSAQGDDSEALLALPHLREAMNRAATPRVLIVRGVGGRELLAGRLAEQGASVDYLELYRRNLPVYPAGTLLRRIEAERLNGLVVSSGRGWSTCCSWRGRLATPGAPAIVRAEPAGSRTSQGVGRPTDSGLPWRQCRGLDGSRAANYCTCRLRR